MTLEEFSIYMNYVRKLGFEEAPDYDFLRELFTKVLKTLGEQEDGCYDWMLLNNGKGWEASTVCRTCSSDGYFHSILDSRTVLPLGITVIGVNGTMFTGDPLGQ